MAKRKPAVRVIIKDGKATVIITAPLARGTYPGTVIKITDKREKAA